MCCTLDLLSPPSGLEKGPMVRDSPRQWAGNVSLLVIAAACKHQLDGCCSTLLGCGSGEYIIPIFWKGKLRMKKNQRKPLEASAIGTQEPFNVKCTFILTPCMGMSGAGAPSRHEVRALSRSRRWGVPGQGSSLCQMWLCISRSWLGAL